MGLLSSILCSLIGSDTTTYGREYDPDQFKPRRPVDNYSNKNTSNYNRYNYNSSTLMRGPQNNNK